MLLTVARAGALAPAARTLGVDVSTVFRRLRAIEARLGVAVFDRLPGGHHQPTESGQRIVGAAERMEAEVLGLARDIAGQDARVEGRLRVTSSETLAYRLLTRHVAAFRHRHPGVLVELAIDNRVLSLERREADVAVRPMRPREESLWGRRLAAVAWALYGSREQPALATPLPSLDALAGRPLIGWEEGVTGIAAADWLAGAARAAAFVFRTSSLVNQLVAARAGIGLALLPCYLGDPEPALVRALPEPLAAPRTELWIVTHRDLRQTARVRAFLDSVGEALVRDRRLIEGELPAV